MPTRMISVEPFTRLYQMEEKARDMYDEYAERINDKEIRDLFKFISLQEQGHMKIASQLIQLIQ